MATGGGGGDANGGGGGGSGGGGGGVGVRTNQTLQTFPHHNSLFISTIGADKVESKVRTLTSSITNV